MGRRGALLGALLGAVVLSSACAGAAASGSVARSSVRTVTVTQRDFGRTIFLRTGDVLVVQLVGMSAPPTPQILPTGWQIVTYPEQALAVTERDPEAGRFRFTARSAGGGQVLVVRKFGCGPPIAIHAAPRAQGCPVDPTGGQLRAGAAPMPVPLAVFRVQVEVTAA